ncbi:hypothetical protein EGW08_020662 [Elysia chlorotica]|uniref:Uncharacterized protein n=1 Tax=Elysia chlorotica TaxID=188477 RepID=A0A433SQN1_ELYCH|nr:hypothetical protein EGW08_020662 [Elysia chlorotica]
MVRVSIVLVALLALCPAVFSGPHSPEMRKLARDINNKIEKDPQRRDIDVLMDKRDWKWKPNHPVASDLTYWEWDGAEHEDEATFQFWKSKPKKPVYEYDYSGL